MLDVSGLASLGALLSPDPGRLTCPPDSSVSGRVFLDGVVLGNFVDLLRDPIVGWSKWGVLVWNSVRPLYRNLEPKFMRNRLDGALGLCNLQGNFSPFNKPNKEFV